MTQIQLFTDCQNIIKEFLCCFGSSKPFFQRYWKNFVLSKPAPVHYTPPEFRYYWDNKRNVQLETEVSFYVYMQFKEME